MFLASTGGYVLVTAVSIALAYLLIPPILILLTFRQDANPKLELVDPQTALPGEVQSYFSRCHEELAPLGFENVGTLFLPNQLPNVRALLALYVDRDAKTGAMPVVMYAQMGDQWSIQTQYVEFSTSFTDGSTVNTGNQNVPGAFPVREGCISTLHPELQSSSVLYEAHRAVLQTHRSGRQRVMNLDSKHGGNVPAYIAGGMREEFEHAVNIGYLKLDQVGPPPQPREPSPYQPPREANESAFRPTIKGAYLMTWQELWPFKPIRVKKRIRRDAKFLAETGFSRS